MGRKSVALLIVLLLQLSIVSCGKSTEYLTTGSQEAETIESMQTTEEIHATEEMQTTDETLTAESMLSAEPETISYSHGELYLSIDIPEGWEYEIKPVESQKETGRNVFCGIDFWSVDFPEDIFELGYYAPFGMCGTGVEITEFTLENGITGFRYTESNLVNSQEVF
ncbi:MAG: hypothetical protein PHS74_11910 [Lachnospiraceae bacterium]|nr:hypothetical protein [Lachnospiraceae bacterium]